MIKLKFEIESETKNETPQITWVTKANISNSNERFTGLRFHKLTPRIREVLAKNICDEF